MKVILSSWPPVALTPFKVHWPPSKLEVPAPEIPPLTAFEPVT
eukprot:CAMPEP_0179013336 /NCGR_PEP_ID=MMETSP0796-20121207/1672_1 /TAXON_ID=73915 /ORGANISM="Pyrodinium bahamense, Strain pbaha01" /LENGTH=42 /DNA_ID= /DNA_START= /DNA_END= /DNA_ORIENTATION=